MKMLNVNTSLPVIIGTILMVTLLSGCEGCKPKCDNCHSVIDNLYECVHYVGEPNGTPCSKTACIENNMDTHSCDYHKERTDPPKCDSKTQDPAAPAFIQVARSADCAGGTITWVTWQLLYYGCGTDCTEDLFRKACETASCTGPVILGPFNRGSRRVCGC